MKASVSDEIVRKLLFIQYNHGFKYPDFVKFGVDKDDEDARITLENFGPVLSTI